MVLDVFIGFILLVLIQDVLTGHTTNNRQVSWRSLGNGRITHVQQELTVIDDPGSCNKIDMKIQTLHSE